MTEQPRVYSTSIRTRIESAILFTTALVLATAYIVLMVYEWRQTQKDIVQSIATEARIIAADSTAAMAFRAPDDAASALASASSDERILAAFLYDTDDRLFASYNQQGASVEVPKEPPWTAHVVQGDKAWLTQEVTQRGESLGTLVVVASLKARERRLVAFGLLIGMVFGVGLVLATLLSGLLKRRIAAPILSLTEAVETVARRKDFSVRVQADSTDEVGVLARTFNQMLVEVQQRDRALSEREQEFRALVEQSPDIICRFDRGLRVVYMSPASTRLIGRPPSYYLGRRLVEIGYDEQAVEQWEGAITKVFETGRPSLMEHEIHTVDRGILAMHTRLVPEVNQAGEVVHVLTVGREITERRRVEEALRTAKEQAEAAARSKSTFLANMSHDIRTPLTSIIGFAEILSERLSSDNRDLSDMIREGGKRLLETLNSVLDLARLEGGTSLKRKHVDIARELANITNLFKPRAADKGLALELTLPEGPATALLDGAAFGRIMINLIGNALKFTNEGRISVSLESTLEDLIVTVADTGPGIPEEFLPNIFDAFSRSRTSESERVEGSGLGLTITKQLAELIGGQLRVTSKVGEGSAFVLKLPRAEHSADPEESARAQVNGRKNILIAEDNQNIQTLLKVILADRFATTICTRSDATVEEAGRKAYDLVLMDIALESSEAGIEALRRLRRMEGYSETPVIAFTAHALPEEFERFRNLGFNDLLQKPFSPRQLNELLARHLS